MQQESNHMRTEQEEIKTSKNVARVLQKRNEEMLNEIKKQNLVCMAEWLEMVKSPDFDVHLANVREAASSSENIIPNPIYELLQSLEPLIDGVYAELGTVDEVDVDIMTRIKLMMPSKIKVGRSSVGASSVYPYLLGYQILSDNPMGQVTWVLERYLLTNVK